MPYIWLLGAILIILLLWIAKVFNAFISKKNRLNNAWSDITVQLKRRYDLIPNLVEVVKGYAGHEATVFEKIAEVRSNAMKQTSVSGTIQAENELTGLMKQLFMVSESYPELKASENFQKLQEQLTLLENDIASARQYYNATVRELNNSVQVFPTNIVARMFGFSQAPFFNIRENEKAVVNVSI